MKTGVIFAWDGIVIDASEYHKRSWEMLAEENQLMLPPGYLYKSFGHSTHFTIAEILHWSANPERIDQLAARKQQLLKQIFTEEMPGPVPGIRGLLRALKSKNIPCAIACPAFLEEINFLLEMMDLRSEFAAVIAHGNVLTPVSATEALMLAVKSIACAPEDCIAVQSTISGIEAAKTVGLKTVAIATLNPADLLERAGASVVLNSLKELDAGTITSLRVLG